MPMPMPSVSMAVLLLVVPFVSLLVLCRPAGAAEYTVGDGVPNGWDTGTNYVTWAQSRSFAVGDVLVFQYVKSQHNVYEVKEGPYRTCDADTDPAGVLARYDSGLDIITLTEAKTYWFICQVAGHCTGGMRVAVNVSAAAAGRTPSPSSSAPLPPSDVGSAASQTAGGFRRSWMVAVALAALAVVVNMLA